MLRRKPTAITLTTEDIAIYEDARAAEALQREQAAHQAHLQAQAQRQGTPGKNQNVRDSDTESHLSFYRLSCLTLIHQAVRTTASCLNRKPNDSVLKNIFAE